MAHKIAYARVSTADQNPELQQDALAAEGRLKIYTDTATGTKSDRPQWNECLKDLRLGDTLIVWTIDRLGRNLRDLIDIVTTLQTRAVWGVRSLTNGIVDTTTAHGALVFGIFALMAEYEAARIRERTQVGLAAARARGRRGGRKPKMTPALIDKAQRVRRTLHHDRNEVPPVARTPPMWVSDLDTRKSNGQQKGTKPCSPTDPVLPEGVVDSQNHQINVPIGYRLQYQSRGRDFTYVQ